MANNIFDTRNIIKETPKVGNRFLLTADATTLGDIIINSPLYRLLKIKNPNSFKKVFFGDGSAPDAKGATTVLDLSLLNCTIPAFEFETGELNHFNDTVKHLTKFSSINDMSTSFYDYINGSSTTIMLAWQSAVGFKLTGEMGYKEDYVCDMDLFIYGPNRPGISPNTAGNIDEAKEGALMQYKILNAWPRSVDVGEFSYDSAEIKKVSVQFAYDMIVPVMISSEDDAGPGLKLNTLASVAATETALDVSSGELYGKQI